MVALGLIVGRLAEMQLFTASVEPHFRAVRGVGIRITEAEDQVGSISDQCSQGIRRAKVYAKAVVYSGPIYKSMAKEGSKIRLQFDHVGGGLAASDDRPLADFTIAGANQKFVPAVATIDGNSIVVASDQVARPVAVRYAWHDDTQPNFANKEGLPASPFRTDSWKGVTEP